VKSYRELISIDNYGARYEYLKETHRIGDKTFGYERYLNQALYNSNDWKPVRTRVIVRDNACDMAMPDHEIQGRIIVHHINPITIEMIIAGDPRVFDMDNLVCVSHLTHEAIHYGDKRLLPQPIIERKKGDTTLWRR
jgi:hypothetical protein